MVGGRNKREEKAESESIKIKYFLIRYRCKVFIICLNKYACRKKKNANEIQKINFIFWGGGGGGGLKLLGRLS